MARTSQKRQWPLRGRGQGHVTHWKVKGQRRENAEIFYGDKPAMVQSTSSMHLNYCFAKYEERTLHMQRPCSDSPCYGALSILTVF